MRSVDLKLSNGYFNITDGQEFAAHDAELPFLCYEENGIWHAVCRPDDGAMYDSEISVPYDSKRESINISARGAALSVCRLSAGTIIIELKESSADFKDMAARRISLSVGRGSASICAAPSVAAAFACGSGRLDIRLPRTQRGYFYDVSRGAGTVTINSASVARRHAGGTNGGVRISIRCGLGSVNITEY